jgi:hypothetical protein
VGEVILSRVYMNGKDTYVASFPKELRTALGIVARDVIGFRVIEWRGKKMLLGEKIPLHLIATLKAIPMEALPEKALADESK